MRVYGRAGAPPRNTAAGVAAAFGLGAYGVEVDVRRTPEGLLVCSDAPLDGSPVDAFADVLAAARGPVVAEVRSRPGEPDFDAPASATAHLLADLLRGRDDVTVASFDWFAIEVARDAGLPTAFLTPSGVTLDASLAYVADAGHTACLPNWSAVTPESVATAHERGKTVVCWGVDSPEVALRMRDAGVDGALTDDLAAILAALDDD